MTFWSKLKTMFGGGDADTAPSGTKDAPLSPEEAFTREVEAALRELPHVASFSRKAGAFGLTIRSHAGEDSTLFLGNVFAETRDVGPEERAFRIHRVLSVISTSTAEELDWEEMQERLVPLLRSTTICLTAVEDPEKQPLRRPFAPFLVECVALDTEHAMRFCSASDLATHGVDAETFFATGRSNAARYFQDGDVEKYDASAPYPLWHVAKDDSYESSRLLVPGWLASFLGRVNGRPLAIVPHRSSLIVGGDADPECVRRLAQTALREHAATPRSISPAVYTVDDAGKVIPYRAPSGHAAERDVALGHLTLAVAEYQAQKEALDQRDEDVFTAKYTGVEGHDGGFTSYCVWAKDVLTSLPETEQIAFIEGTGSDPFRVSWDVAREVAGALLTQEPGLNPLRWRTGGFPSGAMLAALKLRALR